jgi:membrane protein YqaA with SNARE-associated domain
MTELAALFVWSFLAATILPLGSEPALAVIASRSSDVVVPVIIATAGNYLGACTTWWLARVASERFGATTRPRAAKAMAIVRRYGAPALLLSWVPLIGDAIVAAAGAARIGFVRFSLWTALGKGVRYAAVAWTARHFL